MRIVERFICSKFGRPEMCEDGLFINERFVAVIDGVSAKGQRMWGGKSGGYRAKEVILRSLENMTGDEDATLLLPVLNRDLFSEYGDENVFFRDNPEERLMAALAVYSAHHREVWCFGDCQAMIDGALHTNEMRIDALVSEFRSLFLKLELARGTSVQALLEHDPSYEVIYPLLKRQSLLANDTSSEYGFSVLDGFCGSFEAVKIHKANKGSEVVLATDGYPALADTLAESEARIRSLEEVDPLCIEVYRSTRGFAKGKVSYDDRTYVRFLT